MQNYSTGYDLIGSKRSLVFGESSSWDYYKGKTSPYYTGPLPEPNDKNYASKLEELELIFLSANLVGECIDRHCSALVGKPFFWQVKNNESGEIIDQDDNEEIYKLISQWVDYQRQQVAGQECNWGDPFRDAIVRALVEGTGYWRLWMPQKYRNSPTPHKRIALHSPEPGAITIDRDEDEIIEVITYTYNGGTQRQYWYDPDDPEMDGTADEDDNIVATDSEAEFGIASATSANYHDLIIESTRIDKTTASQGEQQKPSTTKEIDIYPQLNEQFTLYEIKIDPLVTDDVKRVQNSCNLALTTLNINLLLAGYRTKYFSGTLPPGEYVNDPDRPGQKKFAPSDSPLQTGPNKSIFLQGITYGDSKNPSMTTPSVTIEDPVSVDAFERTVQLYRTLAYLQFGQGYVLNTGDGGMSGVSRIHIKQDFVISIERQVQVIESALSGLLTSILRLLDESQQWSNYSIVVHLRPWLGNLLPEERSVIIETYEKGLCSKTTAMSLLGDVDDVQAEWELMMSEPSTQFDRLLALHEKGAISTETLLERSGLFSDASAEIQKAEAERMQRMQQMMAMQAAQATNPDDSQQ